ncbi:hypothetical protein TCDM_10661 [Trypanosoma cruzi Dm28c]|uniref:Uncharacterized protein n=1 Tax=Trypanosoma cruzi Dm28c TaxID=1416333 RepID=V5B6V8_TRYCR|nr:hypothetical protein TCDM_10661 [Trypanosoma cruzi Dm28c]
MDGRRQEALTINMVREHAATPHAVTKEEKMTGEKQEAAQHTRREQTPVAGKATPRPSTWPATPHQPSQTHHRSAASPRTRGFGHPHNKRTHRQQSPTNGRGEATHRHRLHFNPSAKGIRPQLAANKHNAHGASNHLREPHAEAIPHPPMTRCLTTCVHTDCALFPQ